MTKHACHSGNLADQRSGPPGSCALRKADNASETSLVGFSFWNVLSADDCKETREGG